MTTKLTDDGSSSDRINGRYRLLEPLGHGAQGIVFKVADQFQSGRVKVLKALRPGTDARAVERLRWEFVRLARLDHPRLLRVFDLDVADGSGPLEPGQLFFTAEYSLGVHPTEVIAQLGKRRRSELLWRIATDVASALDHIHGKGLLHGDVKPENLLCTAHGDVKLIDLGLATAAGALGTDEVSGTLDHLAPEALAGCADQRADLYGLGSTLYFLASDRLARGVDHGGSLSARIRALQAEEPPPLRSLEPGLPEGFCTLVDSLLARDPEQRPRSARVLLEQIARKRRTVSLALGEADEGLALLATGVVGRDELAEAVTRVVGARLKPEAEPLGLPAVVVLRGETGAGRSTTVGEVVRRLQLRAAEGALRPAQHASGPTLAQAVRPLVPTASPSLSDDSALAELISELETAVARRPGVIVVEDGEADAPVLRRLFGLLRRDPGLALGRLALLVRAPRELELNAAGIGLDRRVEPLTAAEVRELVSRSLGGAPDDAFVQALQAASGGLPGLLMELLRAAWAEAGDRRRVAEVDVNRLTGEGLVGVAAARLTKLPERERRVALGLAIAGETIPLEWAAQLAELSPVEAWEALDLLLRHDLVALAEGQVRLAHPAYGEALVEASGEDTPALHARLADLYGALAEEGDEAAQVAQVEHMAAGPADARLPELAARTAEHCSRRGEWAQAARLLSLAREVVSRTKRRALSLSLAEAQVRRGAYDEGLAELDELPADLPAAERLQAATIRGLALQRRGELRAAREVLDEALASRTRKAPARRLEAQAILGRVLLDLGEPEAAAALCPSVEEAPREEAGVGLLEIGGLARYYGGDLAAARRFFDEATARVRDAGDDARLARALCYGGMVRQTAGDLDEAAACYADASQLAEQQHDLHGQALYAGNLGVVLKEKGRLAEALEPSVTSVRRMIQLGKTGDLPTALFNLGNLLLCLGDLEGASRELALMAQEAERVGRPMMRGYLLLLASDLKRRAAEEGRELPGTLPEAVRGRKPAALAAEAARVFAEIGATREQAYACIAELECWAVQGRPEEASRADEELSRLLPDLEERVAHLASLARGRLALAGAALPEAEPGLDRASAFFAGAQLNDLTWRAEVVRAALLSKRRAYDEATERLEGAEALMTRQRARLPEAFRKLSDRDPDAVQLARVQRRLARVASGGRGASSTRFGVKIREHDAVQLRRLLDINKRLNTELRLPILLELVLDAVLELTDAERGFILLIDEQDALEVRVARNMDKRNLAPGEFSLSQSIAEQATRAGEAVLTVDAAMDERFSDAVSVHGLRIRSVLAVPLRVKGRVVGTVYVDNRLRRGAFSDGDLALVQDFAEQAAIAIENARLHEELQEHQGEIERLNEELSSEVARQEAEIQDMRTELKQNAVALRVRYDYSNIVGSTPAMTDMFHLLDRITDVDLPVVIHGESGTGKELVARAIHFNGPRSERPFVSENCGAVPETLLESILFGHVRGAFTGADRDRRGLFEVAHGGTLFLDEVGEMSPAMQTKLLRVLQDGELRRVGGDRVHKVDVRIIAASNRELAALVEQQRFRQDLFYRLNVLQVTLPPLRARVQDVVLLVEHFVGKYSADRPRRVSRAAMDRLMAYHWPGNVRELENEVQRALALGGDLLGLEDLSAQVRGQGDPEAGIPDGLDLRSHVEVLERDLLQKALERTGGNQTQAAKLLGLSRYGLLKKLKRYGMLKKSARAG